MTPARILLRRTLGPLLALALVGGIAVGIATARQPPRVDGIIGFVVPIPAQETKQTLSDLGGSDPIEAAGLFVGTLSGWLASPEFAHEVYRRASLPEPATSVRKLSRVFEARRRGGQVVDVNFRAKSADEAERISRALRDEVSERASAFSGSEQALSFRAVAGEPLVVPVQQNPLLRGLVAGVVILVVGLNAVFLWDFLRTPPTEPRHAGI